MSERVPQHSLRRGNTAAMGQIFPWSYACACASPVPADTSGRAGSRREFFDLSCSVRAISYQNRATAYTVGADRPVPRKASSRRREAHRTGDALRRTDETEWLVRLVGIEPTAIRLKVECSTTELQAREDGAPFYYGEQRRPVASLRIVACAADDFVRLTRLVGRAS